ncbi:GntR family transcriptional regulator [Pseudonocardia sp. SCN 73-27]|uniref:GntR family transcriptional regulator n=1 Tax=unclassified Pseudonocardia TaxID=2619320 RepID=UPI0034520890
MLAPPANASPERTLAADLCVSCTVVRGALRDLADEGRIEIRAQSGSYLLKDERDSRPATDHC